MSAGAAKPAQEPEERSWLYGLGLSKFVALDLETTGLDPSEDSIIEIGAARFVNGKAAASFHSLIRYERRLDTFVAERTGIASEQLKNAPAFSEIADKLLTFIGDDPIVGQTPDFHLAFLRSAGQEMVGPVAYNPFLFARTPVLDVGLVAKTFWPEWTSFTLPALCDQFDVASTPHHRAKDDADRVGHVLLEIVRRLPERVWPELADDLQRLIGSTTHRSRFFFAALMDTCKHRKKPTTPSHKHDDADFGPITEGVDVLLGSGGAFEAKLNFFSARPSQIQMASEVETSLEQEEVLLVEAPTGVGKSLAYLVPALRWALDGEGRQVFVSSYTKMLQEQLHRKDIGEIRTALGKPFRAAVLKGRNNYLCKRRLRALLREAHERLSESDRIQLMPLVRWSELTTTGDITEIGAFNPRSQAFLWAHVASDSMACAGGSCSAAKGDFHRIAQERASKAHIVFVNHALLFADFARLTMGEKDNRRLILDEAHQVEKAAVSAMSLEVSAIALRNALTSLVDERASRGLLPGILKSHGHALSDADQRMGADLVERGRSLYMSARQQFSVLGERVLGQSGDASRYPKLRFRNGDLWHKEAARDLSPLYLQWLEFGTNVNHFIDRLAELRGEQRVSADTQVELRSASDNVMKIAESFERLLNDDDDTWVKWMEAGRSDYGAWSSLYMSPISVGSLMQKSFWGAVGSAVLTSATLAMAGDFSITKTSLGLEGWCDRPVREVTVESPFRLSEQMRLMVPMFLPDPRGNDSGFVESLSELTASIIERHPRATVILCTSNDMVERMTRALTPVAQRARRPLFSQWRSSSTVELLAEYRKHPNGILIGAATFWEGIDLVGDALEILIVSKIPFDVPTDPWIAARCETVEKSGGNSFAEFTVPMATLRLKQGVGRLIRHANDRGVAIIADPRLATSRYGESIRKSLPVWPRPVRSADELLHGIASFFDEPHRD